MEALLKVMQNIICVLDCVFFCGQCLFSLCNSKTLKKVMSQIFWNLQGDNLQSILVQLFR